MNEGSLFACPTCGREILVEKIQEEIPAINRYNETIIDLEKRFVVNGDTVEYKEPSRGIIVGERRVGSYKI